LKSEIVNFRVEYLKNPIGLETKRPHYSWEFETERKAVYQTEYRIIVKGFIDELFWDSGWVESEKTYGILHEGAPLTPDNLYTVEVFSRLSGEELYQKSEFRTGLMDETFPAAQWICANTNSSSSLFRKTFFSDKKIAFATLYVAARGFYEPYLNGKIISPKRVLRPAIFNQVAFPYECCADAYDVGEMLSGDNNTIGFILGRGYMRGYFNEKGWVYEGGEKLWCALSIQYQDGDTELIVSDDSWLWNQSPIIENSIYGGETYDKNLETEDWALPYINVAGWKKASISKEPEGVMNVCTIPVIKKSVRPCEVFKACENEVTICDFGVNGAGFVRIKVTGEPGTRVIIEHSENIREDGELNFHTNSGATTTDVYILRGNEIEIFEPRFTYHCFRYARISMDGVAQLISAHKITIGADFGSTGYFKCDDAMLQRIYNNAYRSLGANLLTYPSNCAVGDERIPSLLESMAFEEYAINIFDIHSFYRLWLKNCKNEGGEKDKNPLCKGVLIELTHKLYEYYGDTDILETMYPYMKKSIDESIQTYEKNGFGDIYGDWCAPNENNLHNDFLLCFSSKAEAGLCALVHQLSLMAQLCFKMGEEKQSQEYKRAEEYYRAEFYKRFFDYEKKVFAFGSQTANILSIALGVARQEDVGFIYENLLKKIETEDDCHLGTGIIGTQYLMRVLFGSEKGREILSKILHKTDYPSFGQQVLEYDATCLCEQWLGLEGMMTCDHPMFGGIFADYYRCIAGIKNAGENYKKIIIEPKLLEGMTEIKCTYRSVRGEIGVFLKKAADGYHTDVIIPPNCTATVITPDGKVFENLGSGKYML